MIMSDGVLTPAISVVSAIEGLQYQTGISTGAVVGISIAILVLLFALQAAGTQRVSGIFRCGCWRGVHRSWHPPPLPLQQQQQQPVPLQAPPLHLACPLAPTHPPAAAL